MLRLAEIQLLKGHVVCESKQPPPLARTKFLRRLQVNLIVTIALLLTALIGLGMLGYAPFRSVLCEWFTLCPQANGTSPQPTKPIDAVSG